MNRREFFRWLAAATGVSLIEPGHALGRAPVDRTENEIWAWLDPGRMMHIVSFDVAPDLDTVLVLATHDEHHGMCIAGLSAFVGDGQVLVESIVPDHGHSLLCGDIDLALFRTVDCFCPFDGGVVSYGKFVKIRMRSMDRLSTEPVRVGLGLATNTFDLEAKLACRVRSPLLHPFGDVTIEANFASFGEIGGRR